MGRREPQVLWITRAIFMIVVIGVATSVALQASKVLDVNALGAFALLVPIGFFVITLLVGGAVVFLDMAVPNKQITTLSSIYFGLLFGLLFGQLFASAINPILEQSPLSPLLFPVQLGLTVFFCYICVSTLYQTKDHFRFIIPYVEFSKEMKGGRPLVLDTSVIIDGRIADICDTRLIDTPLVVPRFVLHELQSIADRPGKLKRNRGRRGIDILKRLQSNPKVELSIHEGDIPELRDVHEVDQRLVVLAKVLGARVMTNDLNLNKVAQLQGVEVINVNELANALKTVALPGEVLSLRLIKPGDQVGQGVGYLDDGTMVVAEQGRQFIGQEVTITVTSILQTPAGRMIFGRADSKGGSSATHQPLATTGAAPAEARSH
ncbi:MAG TPA: PIN domain-containing protein [Gemmatales bacterium]|nr:PIN domain-containing protein [Gemmatales bacterium]